MSEETRAQILNAAFARFATYGYNKTTMVEIAKDCDMSAANLYRFFDDKQAIGAVLARRTLSEKEQRLRDFIVRPDLTAVQRLEGFFRTLFTFTYEQFHNKPRINELVEMIFQERGDIVTQHKANTLSLLAVVLTQGHASGEFVIEDPSTTAEAVLSAAAMFCFPHFLHVHSKQELDDLLTRVVHLLVHGLKRH